MKKNKDVLIAIIVLIFYLLLSQFSSYIFILLGFNKYPLFLKIIILIIYELLILFGVICIYLKTLQNNFKDFKNNFKYYVNNYLKYWFLNFGLMVISSILISIFTNLNNSTNQEYIIKSLNKFPIYTMISTIIIAPLTEELIFRLNLHKIFKNNILFILISGLLFGSLHLLSAQSIQEFVYIIPYGISGIIFAYTLQKSNNIFVPISLHFLHNSIMMLMQLLTLF